MNQISRQIAELGFEGFNFGYTVLTEASSVYLSVCFMPDNSTVLTSFSPRDKLDATIPVYTKLVTFFYDQQYIEIYNH